MAVGCVRRKRIVFIDSCVFLGAVSFAIFLDAQDQRCSDKNIQNWIFHVEGFKVTGENQTKNREC